ncbi:hypothetical protein E0W68_08720 [Flavobacterium salilacus subsp. salilacus]|uniref:putative phage abortive infection protein n=1 Tax=Flavobacterium TaxID=237 RepID=UPI001074FD9F|nr:MULTISPECIES: putative phage abortive infection protein [Flavobacterium]KAF2518403.1 hypothetical protein E0W68_08720 [Flavobacterium salilacus subsp. salilacus]MBE1615037.1 hypothetical protein [Flavobacterium sp. SaA2.13]
MKRKFIERLLVFFPLAAIIVTIIIVWAKGHVTLYDLDFDKLSGIGGFIGGMVGTYLTIIATFYIYKTFHYQKKELKSQKKELENQQLLISQQQFETTFFNLLNVHRELKKDIRFDERFSISYLVTKFYNDYFSGSKYDPKTLKHETHTSANVFPLINNDLINVYRLHGENKNIIDRLISSSLYEIKKELFDKLSYYSSKYSTVILQKGDEFDLNEKNKIHDLFEIIFFIYKNQISHYCRNVYHILKFIRENEEKEQNSKEKYKQYADLFQSQLNVSEQVLLFYNFFHFDNQEKGIYSTVNLVNHYSFLENVGIENLLNKVHTNFYNKIDFK